MTKKLYYPITLPVFQSAMLSLGLEYLRLYERKLLKDAKIAVTPFYPSWLLLEKNLSQQFDHARAFCIHIRNHWPGFAPRQKMEEFDRWVSGLQDIKKRTPLNRFINRIHAMRSEIYNDSHTLPVSHPLFLLVFNRIKPDYCAAFCVKASIAKAASSYADPAKVKNALTVLGNGFLSPSAFLNLVAFMANQARKTGNIKFSASDSLALQIGYSLLDEGEKCPCDFAPIARSEFRPYSTYLSLADAGMGHLEQTSADKDLLAGTICHIEYIDREGVADKSVIEAYRIPSARIAARIRLKVGVDSPCTVYIGRPIFENKDFELDLLKSAHTVAAACSAMFSAGIVDCKIAMDGMTCSQAVKFMQAVAGNTIRVRRIQMLSAAFNLNTPLEVDINKTRRRLKAPKEIAHQAIELARLGQFDKIAWDGAGGKGSLAKSTQSAPIIGDENSSLSAQELIELTHIAHQAGLETYISAGMDHTHMETAVCCGVGGVGIGTRFHESVNPSTGLMGVLDKQKITSCLDNRNNAEASPAGKAAFRLKCLDWQSLEQKLSAKEQALQQQLFALLREYVGLSNAAPERLQLNSKLTQQLSQELSPVRDNKSRRARGGQDALAYPKATLAATMLILATAQKCLSGSSGHFRQKKSSDEMFLLAQLFRAKRTSDLSRIL